MTLRVLPIILALWMAASPATAAVDPLAAARKLYNQGEYDKALEAAKEAAANPATAAAARLVIGRIRLERYRQTAQRGDLEEGRIALRALDTKALDARERIELQVGLAEILYFDDQFGAAAEILDSVLDASQLLGAEAHERALDWWASALDRYAQARPVADRIPIYARAIERMEGELRRDPSSTAAAYWLVAATRGAGDLERAWSAAAASWVRAMLAADRGAALRADLDRLVTQALIPDRAARLVVRDRRQAMTSMTSEWEEFKSNWSK
jgi:tetratricopeptide (TPR) repeat protein